MNQDLSSLSKDELIQRVLESEAMLSEFQESSKDLERALEDELQELELNNISLTEKINQLTKQLASSKAQLQSSNKETDELQELIKSKDEQIYNLQQKLVKIEIINDSMESQDRVIHNKYEIQQQFNNELLEKIALLEDDYERVKKHNFEKQLFITNYQNQIKELQDKLSTVENTPYDPDVSMVSFQDMLKSTPPPGKIKENNTLKKSDSLQKLKSLTMDIETFLGSYRSNQPSSKLLKSPSTTQLTTSTSTDKTHNKSKEKRISYSKRFSTLPSINGSPTPSKCNDIKETPKSSKALTFV